MKTFYVTCISDQHVQALRQFLDMYHDDVRWRFRIGILIVPSKDGSLCKELFDIDSSIPVLLDNGAYIHGTPLPVTALLNALRLALKHFENVLIPLPDVVEDPVKTVQLQLKSLSKVPVDYRKHFAVVIQGRNVREYVECFEYLKRIAINTSRVVAIGGLKVKKPSDRVEIIAGLCSYIRSYRPHNISLKVHVFGMDIRTLRETHRHYDSCDSANWTFNATTGHGLTIITRNMTMKKINIYVKDVDDWVSILAHELFQYLYLINMLITEKFRRSG